MFLLLLPLITYYNSGSQQRPTYQLKPTGLHSGWKSGQRYIQLLDMDQKSLTKANEADLLDIL